MHSARLTILAVALVSLAACKEEAATTVERDNPAETAETGERANGRAPSESSDGRRDGVETTQGGAFARQPGFQLPVPVSSAQQMQAPSAATSRQIDLAGVTAVVLEGLDGTGSNVKVRVNPGGIVALSGEVGSVAHLQRAHYLARAQPGVVEVDHTGLRVRQ